MLLKKIRNYHVYEVLALSLGTKDGDGQSGGRRGDMGG